MKLRYKAVSSSGETIQGVLDARDAKEAAIFLRERDFLPIKIVKEEKSRLLEFIPVIGTKVRTGDIVNFTRQVSSMLTSGLTLLRSLEILKNQVRNQAMAEIIDNIIRDIQEGETLSNAISKFPRVFSPVYVSLIEASEESGILDKSFLRLADNLEKQQKLKGTVRSALTYPAIVVGMMGLVSIIMLVFVIPQISSLYESLNVDLPLPTVILIQLSNFFIFFWPVPLVGSFASVFLYRRWHKTVEGQLVIDGILLKIPIFGKLIQRTILAEFSRTLGILLASGTLVVKALNRVANITGNIHYTRAIENIGKRVEKGINMGDAMSAYPIFPPNLVELVKIGEQTGKLDETLVKASEYFEGEVDQTVKTLSTAMEPIILIILGIGVAFLVLSILTPIYQITSSIQ